MRGDFGANAGVKLLGSQYGGRGKGEAATVGFCLDTQACFLSVLQRQCRSAMGVGVFRKIVDDHQQALGR